MDVKILNMAKHFEGDDSGTIVRDVKEIRFLHRPSEFSERNRNDNVIHDEQDMYRSTYMILIVTEDDTHLFPMYDRVVLPAE